MLDYEIKETITEFFEKSLYSLPGEINNEQLEQFAEDFFGGYKQD